MYIIVSFRFKFINLLFTSKSKFANGLEKTRPGGCIMPAFVVFYSRGGGVSKNVSESLSIMVFVIANAVASARFGSAECVVICIRAPVAIMVKSISTFPTDLLIRTILAP